MLRRMFPNATQNCSRTANFGSSGQRNRHGIHLTKALSWLTWLTYSIPKSRLSSLESGGREGIRTPGLLVANGESLKLRRVATIS